jgi:hypothetical protein
LPTPHPPPELPRSKRRAVIYLAFPFIYLDNKKNKKTSGRQCVNQARIEKLESIYKKFSKKVQFNIKDCVHSLPLLGHAIWYCIKQPSCMSLEDATTWNCYNIFGYQLYNYIFSSYFHFSCNFLIKCLYRNKINEDIGGEN